MNYKIQVPHSTETFVDAVSLLVSPTLTKQEKALLAHLLTLNIEYKLLPMRQRMAFILSSSTKKSMSAALNIKTTQLSNLIRALQKKQLYEEPILEDDKLNQHLDIPSVPENIIFALIKPLSLQSETETNTQQRDTTKDSGQTRVDPPASGGIMEALRIVDKEKLTAEEQDAAHNEYGKDDSQQSEQ